MRRRLYGIVLVLGAALLALPARLPGQLAGDSAPLMPPPFPAEAPPTVPAPEKKAAEPAPAGRDLGGGSGIALEVAGPAEVIIGKQLSCAVRVRNAGSAAVAGLRIELPLPAEVRVLSTDPPAQSAPGRLAWDLGELGPGGERVLKLELMPPGPGEVSLLPEAHFRAGGLRARVVEPPLALSVAGPASAPPGSPVVFEVRLANRRDTPIEQLVLRAQLSPGLKHSQGGLIEADLGALAGGQVRTIRLEARAAGNGPQSVEVSARAAGGLEARARAEVVIQEPVLALRAEGPRSVALGQEMTLGLTAVNSGTAPARNVWVVQRIPEGVEFVDTSTQGRYDPASGAVFWSVGEVAPGGSQRVTLRVRARLAGDWAFPAAARAEGTPEVRATHAVHLEGAPALALELRGPEALEVGGEGTYELRVANGGTAPCSAVAVVVLLPENLTAVQAEGPSHYRVEGNRVVFDPLGHLVPHVDGVYRLRVRGRQVGSGRFGVQVHAGASQRPLTREWPAEVRERSGR